MATTEEMNRVQLMKECVEMYSKINTIGCQLADAAWITVEPFIGEGKFHEALRELDKFYAPAYLNGDCVLIERDMIRANIIRLINNTA